MTISEDRADRIEGKIDTLTTAVNRLALIDERQIEAGKRMGVLEDRVAKNEEKTNAVDMKVEKWINRGVGIWAIVGAMFALYQTFAPLIHKGP